MHDKDHKQSPQVSVREGQDCESTCVTNKGYDLFILISIGLGKEVQDHLLCNAIRASLRGGGRG